MWAREYLLILPNYLPSHLLLCSAPLAFLAFSHNTLWNALTSIPVETFGGGKGNANGLRQWHLVTLS